MPASASPAFRDASRRDRGPGRALADRGGGAPRPARLVRDRGGHRRTSRTPRLFRRSPWSRISASSASSSTRRGRPSSTSWAFGASSTGRVSAGRSCGGRVVVPGARHPLPPGQDARPVAAGPRLRRDPRVLRGPRLRRARGVARALGRGEPGAVLVKDVGPGFSVVAGRRTAGAARGRRPRGAHRRADGARGRRRRRRRAEGRLEGRGPRRGARGRRAVGAGARARGRRGRPAPDPGHPRRGGRARPRSPAADHRPHPARLSSAARPASTPRTRRSRRRSSCSRSTPTPRRRGCGRSCASGPAPTSA